MTTILPSRTNEVEDLYQITIVTMAAIVRDRLSLSSPSRTPSVDMIINTAMSIQPFLMTDNTAIPALWERLRADENVTSLLLLITFDYIVTLGGLESAAANLVVDTYADALVNTVSVNSIMDETMKERSVPKDKHREIKEFIRNNMWFTVLMIIGRIPMSDPKLWVVAAPPAPVPQGRRGNGSVGG